MTKKMSGMLYTNDPNTVLSYGILGHQIMTGTINKIQWRLISKEIQYLRPEIWNGYVRYPSGRNMEEFYTSILPDLMSRFRPDFFITIDDVQKLRMMRFHIKKSTTWIAYFPIDNHDRNSLDRQRWVISQMDIPILMSKFAVDHCTNHGIPNCTRYIYPMVKTNHTPREKEIFTNREKLWQGIHLGYRKVREDEPIELADIQAYKKSLDLPKDSHVLLFIGRPGWRKNIQFLIAVIRKLIHERERNVVLYMHSDPSDPAGTVNILKELHAHEIPDTNFRNSPGHKWWKGLHTRAMNAIYNITDIQISTHGGEGFGIPLAEGLSCEVPFVATDCTTTPELSGGYKWSLGAKVDEIYPDRGITRPFVDLEDFCDKVEYLLDHPETRAKMGKRGREWVKKNCDPSVCIPQWKEIFESTQMQHAEVRRDRLGTPITKKIEREK